QVAGPDQVLLPDGLVQPQVLAGLGTLRCAELAGALELGVDGVAGDGTQDEEDDHGHADQNRRHEQHATNDVSTHRGPARRAATLLSGKYAGARAEGERGRRSVSDMASKRGSEPLQARQHLALPLGKPSPGRYHERDDAV